MKKFISILFLFIYTNAALGIGLDAHYCGGKLVKVNIHGFGSKECKCTSTQMQSNCCNTQTHYCKTEKHKIQNIPSIVNTWSVEKFETVKTYIEVELFDPPVIQEYKNYYSYVKPLYQKDILSFIQVLRI